MLKTPKVEIQIAFGFGIVALSTLFAVALFSSNQNALLITVARVTLAVACAGIAAIIPGLIDVALKPSVNTGIRAGGALAVFVLVYFFNPPGLIEPIPKTPANPSGDYMAVVDDWTKKIDAGKYREAYLSASKSTRRDYTENGFTKIYEDYLMPRGHILDRKLLGVSSVSQLTTGEKGNFRIITYRGKFPSGPEQADVIILTVEDDNWRVKDDNYFDAK